MAKKRNALAAAASRKLSGIGGAKLSAAQIAHMMFHAEESGEVNRVELDDGGWAWALPAQENGQRPLLRPTEEMLAHYARFASGEGHEHD